MAKIDLNYKVVVTGFSVARPDGDAYSFGLSVYQGVGSFNWKASDYYLLEKWCGGFTKSIDLKRGGKFSAVAGGEIYLDNNQHLSVMLRDYQINLEGAMLRIYYGVGEVDPPELFVGVVTGVEADISTVTLKFDDPSAHRNAVISTLTGDGETYRPALFGVHEKAKAVNVVRNIAPALSPPESQISEYYFMDAVVGRIDKGADQIKITVRSHSANFESALKRIAGEIEPGGASCFYVYCTAGVGKGEAHRIKLIQEVEAQPLPPAPGVPPAPPSPVPIKYFELTLAEQLYTNISSDNDKLTTAFRAGREWTGSVEGVIEEQRAEPVEYADISVFDIYKVEVTYSADAAPGGDNTLYTLVDDAYLPLNEDMFSVSVADDKVYMSLNVASFKDNFEKVETFVQLKGKNFGFDLDYFNSARYDSSVFLPPDYPRNNSSDVGHWDAIWEWWASYEAPNRLPLHAFVHNISALLDANDERVSDVFIDRGSETALLSDRDDIFNNTHTVKSHVDIQRINTTQGHKKIAVGIPFVFEFERIDGLTEIMLNYDIMIRSIGAGFNNDWEGADILNFPRNAQIYEIITALVGSLNEQRLSLRHYPIDDVQSRSYVTFSAEDYAGFADHRLNTCYDLKNFKDVESGEVYDKDAFYGILTKNGNFWRQDVFAAEEFLKQQPGNTNQRFKTRYLSGYEAIRNLGDGGGGFVAIPERLNEGDTLKFRAMLSIAGGSEGRTNFDGPWQNIKHGIFFYAIQCLAKKDFSVGEEAYIAANGRGDPLDLAPMPLRPWDGWARTYENILKWQNYSNSHLSVFTRPENGWGTGYPSAVAAHYREVISNTLYWYAYSNFPVRRQLFSSSELETKNIKEELLRTAWRGGYLDRLGRESVFSMVDDAESGQASVAYKDILPGTLSKISPVRKEDIFCAPSLRYNYDIGRDRYMSSIIITDVDSDAYSALVRGDNHLDYTQRIILADSCKRLYKKYRVINTPPQTLTENKWIYTDEAAYQYLLNWLEWMGISPSADPDNAENDFERREISFTLPAERALSLAIDIGREIELEIPVLPAAAPGRITSVSWSFDRGREEVRCTAWIKIRGGGV